MHTSPLSTFLKLFPGVRVQVYDNELIYTVSNFHTAVQLEATAQRVILENKLPLIAQLEQWGARGHVFGRFIVVKLVPEESIIAR